MQNAAARAFACLLGLLLAGALHAEQAAPPFKLEADNISFEGEGNTLKAVGQPVRVRGPQGVLEAQGLTYDLQADRLLASGGITFTDPSGTTLRAESLELTGDLKQGALNEMRLAVPELGEVLQAAQARRSGDIFTLKNLTYSPCQSCEGRPKAWQVKAAEAEYNQAEATMTYKHARFEVLDVPVLYLPRFSHPLGTDEPRSGLLAPSFGRSRDLGDQIWLGGYYWSPIENTDYTLKTRLMSERGAMLMGERRQVGDAYKLEMAGSWLNDNGFPQGEERQRGHAKLVGEYEATPGTRFGVNAESASDDTYLNQFFDRNDPYLASTVYAEQGSEQQFLGISAVNFQDLNPSRRPAETAQVLPHISYSQWWDVGPDGGQFSLQSDLLALARSSGTDTHRMAGRAAYTLPKILADGSRLTTEGTLRTDAYHISGPGAGNGVITRVLPEVTFDWEKPYMSADGMHQLGPRAMLALSPRGGNTSSKIPNEDSVAYELDVANLFESSRFAGIDRVETGPRFVYGLESRWGPADQTHYRLFVGQSLRRFDDDSLPADGGASTNVSDWVGEVEATPNDLLSGHARWRLDNSTFNVRRVDTGVRIGREDELNFRTTYSFLDNTHDNLFTQLRLPLSENWRFDARSRHDFSTDTLLEAEGALTWLRDCYALEFVTRRRGYRSTNLRPATEYMVNVQLLTLGRSEDSR